VRGGAVVQGVNTSHDHPWAKMLCSMWQHLLSHVSFISSDKVELYNWGLIVVAVLILVVGISYFSQKLLNGICSNFAVTFLRIPLIYCQKEFSIESK
jgi:hypothetical protein